MQPSTGFFNRPVTLQSEHKAAANEAHSRLKATLAGRGALSSSAAMIGQEEIARVQFQAAFDAFLTACDIAKAKGVSEEAIQQGLRNAAIDVIQHMRAMLGAGQYGARAGCFDNLLMRTESLIEQYRDGYISGSGAPSPPNGNRQETAWKIEVSHSPGATIQQGGQGNVQNVQVTFNVEAARQALETLSAEVGHAAGPREDVDEVLQDLAALRNELDRRVPNPTLARELAKSARNILEGAVGGMLSPAGVAAAGELWGTLGLG